MKRLHTMGNTYAGDGENAYGRANYALAAFAELALHVHTIISTHQPNTPVICVLATAGCLHRGSASQYPAVST